VKEIAVFLHKFILQKSSGYKKILDFGCGAGNLVRELISLDYEAFGCDIDIFWKQIRRNGVDVFYQIKLDPYTIPFDNETFDIITSTSVLEHAQNKEEIFYEVKRVLKPGGFAIHLFPGKYYLPYETHLKVPFANYFWPYCPGWYFSLWAIIGIRNEYQKEKNWKKVVELNLNYYRHKLSYYNRSYYKNLSLKVFGNYEFPMFFYIKNAPGNFSRISRHLPFPKLWGWVSGNFRMDMLVTEKM
jgi:SAM-dependent methyltransferase